jgi:hypothetical protein
MSDTSRIGDSVDLKHDPIEDLDSATGHALVARCRHPFADSVNCALLGFIKPAALEHIVADEQARESRAFLSSRDKSAYGFYNPKHGVVPADPAQGGPHATPQRRHVHSLAYDGFPADSMSHRL